MPVSGTHKEWLIKPSTLTDPADWMTTDCVIADPDPHSGIEYHIERLEIETYNRADVTAIKL